MKRIFFVNTFLGHGGFFLIPVAICSMITPATEIVRASIVSMVMVVFPLPAMWQEITIRRRVRKRYALGDPGILIPPSVMHVLCGPMASVSVGRFYMGAIIPELILMRLYIILGSVPFIGLHLVGVLIVILFFSSVT
jgi:TRAP-type mannitol/chloroaromatic compound transport system permease large subunit